MPRSTWRCVSDAVQDLLFVIQGRTLNARTDIPHGRGAMNRAPAHFIIDKNLTFTCFFATIQQETELTFLLGLYP